MSDNKQPSEYLKRTCLICGCHTNQTINIYEPRSGPNIVQLIQAKFKFQPLNEDKYLCFSCNNWLINWHSLQALNSNDAESPSGNFRPQMNGMVQQGEEAYEQQRASGGKQRPVAAVKPMQLTEVVTEMSAACVVEGAQNTENACNNVKRNFQATKARRVRRKDLKRGQYALPRVCACGKTIAVCVSSLNALKKAATTTAQAKCQKCREQAAPRRNILGEQSLVNGAVEEMQVLPIKANIPNNNDNKNQSYAYATQQAHNFLRRPLVDGKIISMLRRVGTTLTREQQQEQQAEEATTEVQLPLATPQQQQQQKVNRENLAPKENNQVKYSKLPQIMSPVKSKPRWTRQLEEDEILLAFNTAISEVLPAANVCSKQAKAQVVNVKERQALQQQKQQQQQQYYQQHQFKRKLEYQISVDSMEARIPTLAFVPQGLSISLV